MSALIEVSPVTVVDEELPPGLVPVFVPEFPPEFPPDGCPEALAVGLADAVVEGLAVPVGAAELPGAWLADGFEVELLVSPPEVFPPSSISYV